MKRLVVAALLLGMSGSAIAEAPGPEQVKIDAATMRRLGIVSAPAAPARQAESVTGFARVLDPSPLAQIDSDIAAAGPTAAASNAEAERSQSLYAADVTVSRKVAQAATAQAQGDSAKLALLRRRLGLEWGPAIARMSDRQRGALVAALARGDAALVRIDSSGGAGMAGLQSATLDLGTLGSASALILGPARAADPRMQSPGLIARVSGAKAGLLSAGLTMPARLAASSAAAGVLIPASAVLRLDGASWAYVQVGAGAFDRRRLAGVSPRGGAIFARGLRPGERVVTSGAAQLLAAERGSGETD